QGFIASFANPGGNITGVTYTQDFDVAGKNLELLKEFMPRLSRVAGLVDATLPGRSEEHTSELQSRFDLVCRLLLEKKNTRKLDEKAIRASAAAGYSADHHSGSLEGWNTRRRRFEDYQ